MATVQDTPAIRSPGLPDHGQSERQHLVRRSIKRLASLADSAVRAGRSILANLPIHGRPWMFDGRLPAPAAHDVVCAMTELEHGLNPSGNPERPVPEPDAYEVFQAVGMTPAWQRYVPWVEGLLWNRKRILADLGWEQWPWQFEHPLRPIAPRGPRCLIRAGRRLRETCREHERLLAADTPQATKNVVHWEFLPGCFVYQNREYPLKGVRWKLLKEFVEVDHNTLTLHKISNLGGTRTSPSRGYSAISELRSALRRLLGLPADFDPIPSVEFETYRLILPS